MRTDYAKFWKAGFPIRHPVSCEPYLIGLSRDEAFSNESTTAATIFTYISPHCFFLPKEQDLLHASLIGSSDEETALALCISHSAVRKRWDAIYLKVMQAAPNLLRDTTDASASRTGAQKKRLLLSYLRDHPEELRPVLPSK